MGRLLVIILLVMCCVPSRAQQRHQHTLHYDRPAHFFEEALVIGNGTLGGIIYGGTRVDSISLNDITLWTGEPVVSTLDSSANAHALSEIRAALMQEDYARAEQLQKQLQGPYSQNYQPLGRLYINYGHQDSEVSKYSRSLVLDEARCTTTYNVRGQRVSTEYYCSHPDQVMVVHIKGAKAFSLGYSSQLPHNIRVDGDELICDGYAAYHSVPHYLWAKQSFWYESTRGIHFRTIVKVVSNNSAKLRLTAAGDSLCVEGGGDVTLLIANATSFNGFDKDPVKQGADYKRIVRSRIAKAVRHLDILFDAHYKDYSRFYDRMELELGNTPDSIAQLPTDVQLRRYSDLNEVNPDLEETYFQFGRYLLISSSRTPGVPATLQGLWNEQVLPPWSSNYTCNINLEENYWPAEVANLSEMHEPLITFLKNITANGATTAKDLYGVNQGWCLGHNSDIWAMTTPVGNQSGDPVWANWNMGGAWLSTHIWEHYLFTRDKAFLKEYYRVLKGSAEFCINWLVEKDGYLLSMPSTSPENKYLTSDGFCGATYYGGAADIAMIRECITDAMQAAQVLKKDKSFVLQCKHTLSRLPDYRIGSNGQLLEWYHDWADAEPTHRHQSHLFGLYPGHQISPIGNDSLAQACRRTLELRGNESTGWSTGWRICLYARLHDSEQAYHTFRKLLRYISPDNYQGADAVRGGGTYPNLLDAHSPFQIDGNFGGCAGVCEILLLHQLGVPLPNAWREGYVKGLCTRDGNTVSFEWPITPRANTSNGQ